MNQQFKANLVPEKNYFTIELARKAWYSGENFILQTKFDHALNGLLVNKNCFRKEDILFLYANKHKNKQTIVRGSNE